MQLAGFKRSPDDPTLALNVGIDGDVTVLTIFEPPAADEEPREPIAEIAVDIHTLRGILLLLLDDDRRQKLRVLGEDGSFSAAYQDPPSEPQQAMIMIPPGMMPGGDDDPLGKSGEPGDGTDPGEPQTGQYL